MLKSTIIPVSAALALAATASAAAAGTRVPNDMSQCRAGSGGTAALVRVVGFKEGTGRVRVQSYSGASNWLERGRWLHRVDIPVRLQGRDMTVCLPLDGPGSYGIAVRHDINNNGSSDRRDGGGFSGNPNISFPFNMEPNYSEVSFRANAGVNRITIVLNYLQGTSVEPIG
ncbi:DUF2141 domain-containing protein [Parasphingopyxis sp. GrpM-11]|uniref:DUF2141 domain-containing protein n=2 Tax=Parasphingopyxis marina TaxID=2761622 RepID=A0A842HXG8_9SPHN|nr:DUF2141 domain-containing protein [Parasphingopyxis marina]